MQSQLTLPNRYALILDPDTIESVLKRAAQWNLPRRECRPLDRYTGTRANVGNPADLARIDAEIEASPMADEEAEAIDALIDASRAPLHSEIDFDDDEEFDDEAY